MRFGSSLKSVVNEILEEIFPRISQGEFTTKEYCQAALSHANAKIRSGMLDFNEYSEEIIAALVERDVTRRSKSPFVAGQQFTLEGFDQDRSKECLIPLGDGKRVTYYDATYRHLSIKQNQEMKAIHTITQQAQQHAALMESEIGEDLVNNPRMTIGEAMKNHGYWQ
jgi:hypothetical protein